VKIVTVLLCLLLLACSPSDAGDALLEKSGSDDALTGRVIDDAFQEFCMDENSCGPGQKCENNTCVPR
jgi:hypothetical protein